MGEEWRWAKAPLRRSILGTLACCSLVLHACVVGPDGRLDTEEAAPNLDEGSGGASPMSGAGGTSAMGGAGGTSAMGGAGGTSAMGGAGGMTPTGGAGGTSARPRDAGAGPTDAAATPERPADSSAASFDASAATMDASLPIDAWSGEAMSCAPTGEKSCFGDCCANPQCTDGLMNGDETDVDCGGCCSPCAIAQRCQTGSDCVTETCKVGVCAQATCFDCIRNGTEEGVDCGGMCAGAGYVCGVKSGCSPSPSCADGAKNYSESDTDCGGYCLRCADGSTCNTNEDCASKRCVSGICAPASCTDGRLNDNEVSTDWGGSSCPACAPRALGDPCTADTECPSGRCVDGVCCDTACDGLCESCNQPCTRGTCTAVPTGLDPELECSSGQTCDARACTPTARYHIAYVDQRLMLTTSLSAGMEFSIANTGSTPLDLSTFQIVSTSIEPPGTDYSVNVVANGFGMLAPGDVTGDHSVVGESLVYGCGLAPENRATGAPRVGLAVQNVPPGDTMIRVELVIAINGVQATVGYDYRVINPPLIGVSYLSATRIASDPCLSEPCGTSCSPGMTRCSGNGVQTCSSTGQWGVAVACVDQACVSGACTGVCPPGATQCSGNGVQTCSSTGQWGAAVACASDAQYCQAGTCLTCASGTANCDSNASDCETDLTTICGTTCADVLTCDAGQPSPTQDAGGSDADASVVLDGGADADGGGAWCFQANTSYWVPSSGTHCWRDYGELYCGDYRCGTDAGNVQVQVNEDGSAFVWNDWSYADVSLEQTDGGWTGSSYATCLGRAEPAYYSGSATLTFDCTTQTLQVSVECVGGWPNGCGYPDEEMSWSGSVSF